MLGTQGEHPNYRDKGQGNGARRSTAGMGDDRARKRVRLINDIPPVQNGVVSASNTPTIDEGRAVDILTDKVQDMSLFFEKEDSQQLSEYEVAPFVKKTLKSTWASEEALRNAVYTYLRDNHGISFPRSSQTSDSGMGKFLWRVFKKKPEQYQESDLASLLLEFSKDNGHQDAKRMQRIMRGLPVTTTSKPDLVPRDNREFEVQIRMGEFKNHKNYTTAKARTQCIMYLLGLLYWLRVELGKPVEAVYGFFFCGIRCQGGKGNKTYTVGLIRLTAPQSLGEEIRAKYMTITRSVDDMYPLHVLIRFLKEGRRWSIANGPILEPSRRVPSVFTLPASLWTDLLHERELVIHGTLSIIFHISGRSLQNLLQDNTGHFEEVRNQRDWMEFIDSVTATLLQADISDNNQRYFLKIRSKDTSLQDRPMSEMNDVWDILTMRQSSECEVQRDACDSMSKTYPVRPCLAGRFGLILMRDRGRALKHVSDFPVAKSIVGEFNKVIHTATFLCGCLPHGDVLPHNLVYDERTKELSLIDVDEGVRKARGRGARDHLLQRKNSYDGDGSDWYIALSYPNVIRERAEKYTQCQLIASFLYLMGKINNLSGSTLKDIEGLQNNAKRLGEDLCKLDKENGDLTEETEEWIATRVGEVYEVMTTVVNNIIAA